VWVTAGLVAGGLIVVVPRLAILPENSAVTAIALVGVLVQAAVLLLVGWLLLPKGRWSAATAVVPAVVGATFCAGAAILLSQAGAALSFEELLIAPVNEEIVKLVAILLVLLLVRSRVRGPLDGLVVGYFVGVGFAVVENALFALRTGTEAEALQSVISRALTSPGTHGVFAGIAGAGLAYLIVSRGGARAWGGAFAAFGIALGLHFFWDATALWVSPFVYLALVMVIYAAGIVAFLLTRRLGAAYESRTIELVRFE
jgi:RsiW-degrading membrane proteinase PrsW (M82 family)